MDENPYSPPETESTFAKRVPVRSRVWWFVLPTLIGVIAGNSLLPHSLGTSPVDPDGGTRVSCVGGFVGLIVGAVLHRLTRPKR